MKQPSDLSAISRGRFVAASSRVIAPVGRFGEELIGCIFKGEVVSTCEGFGSFADVYNWKAQAAFQVKMCNGRHAHRPTVDQVDSLFNKLQEPDFVDNVARGYYAFVFYKGIHSGKKFNGRSKLLSKSLNRFSRRAEVIAGELQYIYLVDVALVHHLAHDRGFAYLRKAGKQRVWECRKLRSNPVRQVLYLNRTFFSRLMLAEGDCLNALNAVFGSNGWSIKEQELNINFRRKAEDKFASSTVTKKSLPVRVIASWSNTRKAIQILPRGKVEIDL